MVANAVSLLNAVQIAAAPRFTIARTLDEGGPGAVFEGTCDGAPAAVKLFHPGTEKRRIERELALLTAITCPTLVRFLGHTTLSVLQHEIGLIAYEYLPTGDLRTLQPEQTPASCETILAVAADVSAAIHALWHQRIVHRDVKPANILRHDDGRFVLADVGLARHLDLSDVTGVGYAPGTQGFMSPEQARGRRRLTIHSDTFALGVTLYWLASGVHPFAFNQQAINEGMVPTPLLSRRPDLPAPLVRAIDGMLAFQPDARISIATVFRELRDRNVCST
jgi:serine/threonine-protein kinase